MDSDSMAKPFLPIINSPVVFHSSRDPGTCKLTPAQCAYKSRDWVNWYKADLVFSLPTVYFFIAGIALFTLANAFTRFAPTSVTQSRRYRRAISGLRFLSYRNLRIGKWTSPSLGAMLLVAVGIAFFAGMTLGPKPYYWPTDAHYGNSPPIATRTGWLALACVPFIFAFGAKANMVSALTGISPEKLNLWHSWASWAMFVLALIHTFPFIVYHNWVGDTAMTFRTGGVWLTGVIALIAQAWLTFMSIAYIRNKFYEFFKATHYLAALIFVVFFFLHCSFRMTSWDYFIATFAIYAASLVYAQVKTLFEHGLVHRASLRLETEHALRIAIRTPSSWEPGQHVFQRFITCGVHALTAHPLTVCSVPGKENEMVFYVQPRGGLTRRLAALASKLPDSTVRVLLEGPYGGMPTRWYNGFDRTLLVAGGSGTAFTLSLIEDWLRYGAQSTRQMEVVLATRDPDMRVWYLEELQHMAERQRGAGLAEVAGLSVHIYETYQTETQEKKRGEEKADGTAVVQPQSSASSAMSLFGVRFFRGRPDTAAAVRETALRDRGSLGVAVCGPKGMVYDVATESAAQQKRIMAGEAGADEVWFHREAFSY